MNTRAIRIALALSVWAVLGLGLHTVAPLLNGLKLSGVPLGYWMSAYGGPILLGLAALWLMPAASKAGPWLSAALIVGVTGTIAAQGHDGLAYTLGIAGAMFLATTVFVFPLQATPSTAAAPRDQPLGGTLPAYLAQRFESAALGSLASGIITIALILLAGAEVSAASTVLAMTGAVSPVHLAVTLAAVMGGAACLALVKTNRWNLAPAVLICLTLLTLLVCTIALGGAGAALGPAFPAIGAAEVALLEKRLADPALIKPFGVPFLRTDVASFLAIITSLALGLALLIPSTMPSARVNRDGRWQPGRGALALIYAVLVLLPGFAAAAKLSLLAQFQTGLRVTALPDWLLSGSNAGTIAICGVTSAGQDAIAKACGKGVGPQGLVRVQDVAFPPDSLSAAALSSSMLAPLPLLLFAASVAALTLWTLARLVRHVEGADIATPGTFHLRSLAALAAALFLGLMAGDSVTLLLWPTALTTAALVPCIAACAVLKSPSRTAGLAAMTGAAVVTILVLAAIRLAPLQVYAWTGSAIGAPVGVARKLATLSDTLAALPDGPGRTSMLLQADNLARTNISWFGLRPSATGLLGLALGTVMMAAGSILSGLAALVTGRRREPQRR